VEPRVNTPAPFQVPAPTPVGLARDIRLDILEMVHRARASHVGSCFSIVDALAVLYGRVMRLRPQDPGWQDRDRFILSKGHAAAAVYATLARIGVLSNEDLQTYGANGSLYMTHVSHKVRGVEFSSGSLGHGLPFGTGKALAAKRQGRAWRVFVMLSDGEMDEGSNWEALMFAAHHRLDNLIALIDYNKLQSLATVADTLALEPLADKLRAFGWAVREVDGHDHAALEALLRAAPWSPGRPSVLIMHTTKGKGVSFMENRVEWHYKSPNDEQRAAARAELLHRHA
jgi:transketolase